MMLPANGRGQDISLDSPATDGRKRRTLDECRDHLVRDLCEWLAAGAEAVSAELFALADSARDRLVQTRLLDLRSAIEQDWPHFVERFRHSLATRITEQTDTACGAAALTLHELDSVDFADLSLVDDADLSRHIVVREYAVQLSETCDDELYFLSRRVGNLLDREEPAAEPDNPLSPAIVCQALSDACAGMGPDDEAHLVLMRRLERQLHKALPAAYQQLNTYLADRNVLPELKRSFRKSSVLQRDDESLPYTPEAQMTATDGDAIRQTLQHLAALRSLSGAGFATAAGYGLGGLPLSTGMAATSDVAAPPPLTPEVLGHWLRTALAEAAEAENQAGTAVTNQVRQVRASAVAGQIGGVEAVAMDIVALLFDLIFDDARIPLGIKAIVSRLQIPVLKVAMLDPEFFPDRQHPARRFLSGISGIVMRWGNAIDESDPFYQKLTELVLRIQAEFESDVTIFGAAVEELDRFVNARQREDDETAAMAARLVVQHEAEASTWERAQRSIRDFLTDSPQPPTIAAFLTEHWAAVLQRIAANGADEANRAGDWENAIAIVADLTWSIQPKKLPDERLKLVSLLPKLLATLNRGLDRIDIDTAARRTFFDALIRMHSAALRGEVAESVASTAIAAVPDGTVPDTSDGDLLVTHSIDNGVEVEEILLVGGSSIVRAADRDLMTQVGALRRGDWIDFVTDDGGNSRERLNWISPQRGILLFSNHRSARAISITPEALVKQLRDGKAHLVNEEPLFERALNGALASISRQHDR